MVGWISQVDNDCTWGSLLTKTVCVIIFTFVGLICISYYKKYNRLTCKNEICKELFVEPYSLNCMNESETVWLCFSSSSSSSSGI